MEAGSGPTPTLKFDRGTIVIHDLPKNESDLPGVLWDERISAYRAPAFRYSTIAAKLRERDLALNDHVPAPARLDGRWADFELRPYQSAALDAWSYAGCRGMIVLPTGSGKTRVALAAIRSQSAAAIVLVPTIALLEQWVRQLSAAYSSPIGQFGDGVHRFESITVATYESAYRHMGTIGARFSLLIVDEAHHFGAGARDEALEMSTARRRLGLTATCPADAAQFERLALLIGAPVYERSISDLAGNYLAPLTHVRITVDLTPEERVAYRRDLDVFKQFELEVRRTNPYARWADLVRASARSLAGRQALAAWRKVRALLSYCANKRVLIERLLARHRESRLLVFCADNAAVYAIARDHLLMPITCDIGRKERAHAIARFSEGGLRGLVSARVLNEGIDLPDADVAIIASAAFGEREQVQRVGRILRPSEGKEALLYELVARGTVEVGWSKRRSHGLDTPERVRLHAAREADHSAVSDSR